MPFDFEEYREKCRAMTAAVLQEEWNRYTRHKSGSASNMVLNGILVGATLGLPLLYYGPRYVNADEKSDILAAEFASRGLTPATRKRDVVVPIVSAPVIAVVSAGVAAAGSEAVVEYGTKNAVVSIIEHGSRIEHLTHLGVEATVLGGEHMHEQRKNDRLAKKERKKRQLEEDLCY